jgi:aminopeptidase N
MPGSEVRLDFDLAFVTRGFVNHGPVNQVVANGTFINNLQFFPRLGYQPGGELQDNGVRRKYDLEPVVRMAKVGDMHARRNNMISTDADWMEYETVVSTSADQIAIAPGYLQKEWVEGNRRFFHYKMDAPMVNFYAYLSARYEVRKDSHQGVNIEIYYHQGHEYNIDKMVKAIKDSLDYFSTHFSPYQHKQVRIIEFPRYGRFAQSFANTIPFSEGIGFVANLEDEDDIDYVYFVTAHEVAHQWWAHQVIPGRVQGSTMVVESMAEYSALMVMEKEYGKEKMRRFLREELDNYLRNRGGEIVEELPLVLVENQAYIHYRKGSMAFYALRDYLGEDVLNQALSGYISKKAFQEPPYTTSVELVEEIRRVAPPEQWGVIEDLLETITLYENKVEKAVYHELEDGRYQVRLTVAAKKLRADGEGRETEIEVDDWIDIGVFAKEKVGGKEEEKVLYLQKHHMTEASATLELLVDELPSEVGIDPYNKLIDRNPEDNRQKPKEADAD